jgi:hypothetical protein
MEYQRILLILFFIGSMNNIDKFIIERKICLIY